MTNAVAIVAIVAILGLTTSAIVAMGLGRRFRGHGSRRGMGVEVDELPDVSRKPRKLARRR